MLSSQRRCGTAGSGPAKWTLAASHTVNRAVTRPGTRQSDHCFSTWLYSSSTGVARPKIDTATLRRARSSSTSSTTPENDVNGPSATRTCSPTSKVTEGFGRSEEHTSELQSLMRTSYDVFCLKKKN